MSIISFNAGEDPLIDMVDASDINSVAGVLKLYFRELREPLFPLHLFDELINCTSMFSFHNSYFSNNYNLLASSAFFELYTLKSFLYHE